MYDQPTQLLARQEPSLRFPFSAACIVLIGTGACLCLAIFAHQPVPAFLLCLCLAGVNAWQAQRMLKREQKSRSLLLASLTTVCQAVLDGQRAARVEGEESLALGKVLNHLLDNYTYLQQHAQARQRELAQVQDQIEQLLYEMKPVIEGDLRTRSTVAGGALGDIADMCNTLVEDTALLVQWAQYMSDQIIQTSHQLMALSVEIAQIMETFVKQHEATMETIESLLAFTLRMESTLFSHIHTFQEHWTQTQQNGGAHELNNLPPHSSSELEALHPITSFFFDMPRQIKLLENLLQKTRETTTLAESTVGELQNVEQRFRHIDGTVMQFATLLSSLAMLADNWRRSAGNYALPVDEACRDIVEESQLSIAQTEQQRQLSTSNFSTLKHSSTLKRVVSKT